MAAKSAMKSGPMDWRGKLDELSGELAQIQQTLSDKRAQRRAHEAGLILHGGAPDSRLEVEENELSRRAEALAAAAEMVKVEIQRTEAEQTLLREEVEQRRRAEVAAEVLKRAEAVDSLFAQAAMHLAALDQSLRQSGGLRGRSLKSCVTRAALAAGLRNYLDTQFVGGAPHLVGLRRQLDFLLPRKGPSAA
jgi:hypothetical protein